MAKTFKIEMIITVTDDYFAKNGKKIEEEITSGMFVKELFNEEKSVINTSIAFELME